MSEPLRVLMVEDSEDDALLIIDVLSRGGYEPTWERVCDPDAMAAALDRCPWGIIISDHGMPRFDALSALKLLRSKGLDVPFIIVSGAIGEDSAVAAMKAGANDYIMKDALARLVPAVTRELRDAETRRRQKRSEVSLRESEARYRALFENSPLPTIVVDSDGRVVTHNYKESDTGIREPGAGARMYVDFASNHENDIRAELMDCIASGEPKEFPEQKYGEAVLSIKISPFPGGAIILAEDVTERKRAEAALRESEQRYRLHFQNVSDLVYSLDPDFNVTSISPSIEALTGYPPEEIIGRKFDYLNFLVPEDMGRATSDARRVLAGERIAPTEYEFVARDGTRTLAEIVSAPQIKDGRVVALVAVGRNITERKKAEARILRSEARYRSLVENLPDNIAELDLDGTILYTNRAFPGLAAENAVGKSLFNYVPEGYSATLRKALEHARETGNSCDYEVAIEPFIGSENSTWWSNRIVPVKESGRVTKFLIIGTDVTNRRRAEEALRESEERYRALFENSPMQTLVVDVEGRIIAFNFARRESAGRRPRIGDRMYVDYAKRHTIDMRRELMDCVATGTPKEFPERKYKDSILSIKMSPFPGGAMIISEDITERVRAEEVRKELTEKLENARRMESLGVLAGGVAHDLNNVLVPLLAYPDLMMASLPEDDPLRSHASRIKESAETAAEIVQDLLTMARRGRCEMEPLNLNDEVESFLRSPEFAEMKAENPDVSIAIGLDTDIMNISASSAHLTKIFMNLVINAFEAMSEGGALRISTSCEYVDKPLGGYDYIKEGDYVVLRVGDTGSGIDEGDLKRIFEPFYSKKKMGRSGSGLGLSIVYGVVRDHGGYIDIRTELGVGSEFALYFPATRDLVREKTETAFDSRGNETILVVDDVERQREVAKELLSSLGYDVETAENGRAAVKYLESNSADLVLLDMIMDDDFDGLDTYRRIVETHPGQRAVIVSGYSETSRVKEARALGAGLYVRKPYTLDKIGRAVRTELDKD